MHTFRYLLRNNKSYDIKGHYLFYLLCTRDEFRMTFQSPGQLEPKNNFKHQSPIPKIYTKRKSKNKCRIFRFALKITNLFLNQLFTPSTSNLYSILLTETHIIK